MSKEIDQDLKILCKKNNNAIDVCAEAQNFNFDKHVNGCTYKTFLKSLKESQELLNFYNNSELYGKEAREDELLDNMKQACVIYQVLMKEKRTEKETSDDNAYETSEIITNKADQAPIQKDGWVCETCTVHNSYYYENCQACYKSKIKMENNQQNLPSDRKEKNLKNNCIVDPEVEKVNDAKINYDNCHKNNHSDTKNKSRNHGDNKNKNIADSSKMTNNKDKKDNHPHHKYTEAVVKLVNLEPETNWKCHCGSQNELNQHNKDDGGYCRKCLKWRCKNCSFINNNSEVQCEACTEMNKKCLSECINCHIRNLKSNLNHKYCTECYQSHRASNSSKHSQLIRRENIIVISKDNNRIVKAGNHVEINSTENNNNGWNVNKISRNTSAELIENVENKQKYKHRSQDNDFTTGNQVRLNSTGTQKQCNYQEAQGSQRSTNTNQTGRSNTNGHKTIKGSSTGNNSIITNRSTWASLPTSSNSANIYQPLAKKEFRETEVSCNNMNYGSESEISLCKSNNGNNSDINNIIKNNNNDRNVNKISGNTSAELIENVEDKWKCKYCNQANDFITYKCTKCSKPAPFSNKWTCEKCTYFNDKMQDKCEVCEFKNCNIIVCSTCKSRKINRNDGIDICAACKAKNTIVNHKKRSEEERKNRDCKNCHKSFAGKKRDLYCLNCTWYCNNQFCARVNNLPKQYCIKCGLKKTEKILLGNDVLVKLDGKLERKMWQCYTCGYFVQGKGKCDNASCGSNRPFPNSKICYKCRWVNTCTYETCKTCKNSLE